MAVVTRHSKQKARKKKIPVDTKMAASRLHTITVKVAEHPERLPVEQHQQPVKLATPDIQPRTLWFRQRPVVGSCLIILAGILVLWGPLALMQFAFLPGNTIWAGLLVGSMLCVLGLLQLFFPAYALVTGVLAIICSLASLMAAAGGFGIGMIFGIIGGAQGVAWCNLTLSSTEYQLRLAQPSSRPMRFWRRRACQTTTSH